MINKTPNITEVVTTQYRNGYSSKAVSLIATRMKTEDMDANIIKNG